MRGAALEKYKFDLKDEIEYGVGPDEVECVDCSAVIIRDAARPAGAQRCDTDEAHHAEACGEDCPVICEVCCEHHFPPQCGGATRAVLRARVFYGGRKGRSAERRLKRVLTRWVANERRASNV